MEEIQEQERPAFDQITQYLYPHEDVAVVGSACPRTSCKGCTHAQTEADKDEEGKEKVQEKFLRCGRPNKVKRIPTTEWLDGFALHIMSTTGRDTEIREEEKKDGTRTGRVALFVESLDEPESEDDDDDDDDEGEGE